VERKYRYEEENSRNGKRDVSNEGKINVYHLNISDKKSWGKCQLFLCPKFHNTYALSGILDKIKLKCVLACERLAVIR
jgi:hypothetical protein